MFTSFKLTNNGKAMHIKSVFGDSIKFTKVAFGSGAKPDDFAQMNELNNVVVSVPFVSYDDTTNQNILNLKWELDTSEISNSFTWSEYGLYAEDKDGNEFLYAYAYDDTPITIDKIEQGVVSLYVGYVTVSITDTDNITVELGEYDTVTVNQFKAHTENANNPHNVTAEQVGLGKVENVSPSDAVPKFTEANRFENVLSGDKTSTLWGKVKKAISTLSNHLLDKNNPHNVIWRHIFSSSNEVLPVEYGGTGVSNYESLKSELNQDKIIDYRKDVEYTNDVFNIYLDGYWKQNNTAYIFATFQVSRALLQDHSCHILTLPAGLRPPKDICVPCQTNSQRDNPTLSLTLTTSGAAVLYSFGYENLPENTFYRFQAVFPTGN